MISHNAEFYEALCPEKWILGGFVLYRFIFCGDEYDDDDYNDGDDYEHIDDDEYDDDDDDLMESCYSLQY